MKNPFQLLEDIKDCLSFNGYLYIEVPSLNSIYKKKPCDNSLGSLHKYLFSNKSLRTILHKTGYDILKYEEIIECSGKITCYALAQKVIC